MSDDSGIGEIDDELLTSNPADACAEDIARVLMDRNVPKVADEEEDEGNADPIETLVKR